MLRGLQQELCGLVELWIEGKLNCLKYPLHLWGATAEGAPLFGGMSGWEVSWLGWWLNLMTHHTQCCAGTGPIVGSHRLGGQWRFSVMVKIQW